MDPNGLIDPDVRKRLTLRFGSEIESWFDALPALLNSLSGQWGFEPGSPIPRGSVCVVLKCRTDDQRPAVLKVSPDRSRLALEAAALQAWRGAHCPSVIASSEAQGALLLEEVIPGTPLDVADSYPSHQRVAQLLDALHGVRVDVGSYPDVARRIDALFESSERLYQHDPDLATVIPHELYGQGYELAARLSGDIRSGVLLHGDLTPSNLLWAGDETHLVAIDPSPCVGDPAFDAIDLLMWQADNLETIVTRARTLAAATGMDDERLLAWCIAFAGMNALEMGSQPTSRPDRIETLRSLARRSEHV